MDFRRPVSLPRRTLLRGGLALGAASALPRAHACEFYAGNFTVVHPWTRATPPDATSAIVCMTFKDVTETDRLIRVQTDVAAGAEMGGDTAATPGVNLVLPAGQTTVLGETGVQLRLVGLKVPLQMGREYPMALFFANAGRVPTKLTVDFVRFL